MKASIASRAGMSRWFVGSSRSSRFDGWMPSRASSSRDRSPPESARTSLKTSSPRNRNRARYPRASPGGHRDRLEQCVEHRRARDRGVRGAGRGSRSGLRSRTRSTRRAAAGLRRSSSEASSSRRRSVRRCRSARRAGRRGMARGRRSVVRSRPFHRPRRLRGPAGTRRRGPRPGPRSRPSATDLRPTSAADLSASFRPARRRLATFGLQPLEPRLVLVHLAELAMAAVALDELLLAGDRLGLVLDVLRHASVALFALAVVGAVVAAERRQAGGRAAPRYGSLSRRGTPGRVTQRGARRRGDGDAPRAIRARRGRGGSSARRGGAGRGSR